MRWPGREKHKTNTAGLGESVQSPVQISVHAPSPRSSQMPVNYKEYRLNHREKAAAVSVTAAVLFMIGMIFYDSVLLALLLSAASPGSLRFRRESLLRKRKQQLKEQFKQSLYSISTSLAAGKSVENAFAEVIRDMKLLYPDDDSLIVAEFEMICRRIENGEPVERALLGFSERAGIEDIDNFTDVFITCKRTGGDLVQVIRRTSQLIGEKLEIEQQISVTVAQKRFESKALSVIPFVIIGFLSFSSPEYMQPLHQGVGCLIMTFSLLVLGAGYLLTRLIMNIEV